MARNNTPQPRPTELFNRSTRMKSAEDRLREIDELGRLDRGQMNTFADDTGSESGYIVPGAMFRGSSPLETAGNTRFMNVAPPQYPEIPQSDGYQFDMGDDYQFDDGMGAQDISSAEGFFNQVAQQLYSPRPSGREGINQLVQEYQSLGLAYPIASNADGTIQWSDGTARGQESINIQPIASVAGGDVLWSDGLVRPGMPEFAVDALSGSSALSRGLFGRDQTVTQQFGQYNPQFGYRGGTHAGTDFRTRDLQDRRVVNYFDMPLEVVESYGQAAPGSGAVGNMENRGYGNSLLLRMPNGMMIRVSHLDQNPWNAGDVINPGDMIGVPGNTGNSTAEHADVEVLGPDGRIISPDQFFAEVRQMSPQSREPLYRMENGQPVGFQSQTPESVEAAQPQDLQPQSPLLNQIREARQAGGNLIETLSQVPEQVQQIPQQVEQALEPMSPQRQALGQIPEQAAQTAGVQAEFGLSEALSGSADPMQTRISALSQQPKQYNPYRQLAGNITERIGDTLGIPEGSFSETIAGGPTKRTNVALADQIGGERPEAVPGIRQNLQDIGRDLQSRATSALGGIRDRFAPEQQIESTQTDMQELQPGAGIDRLKGVDSFAGGAGANLFSRMQPQDMAGNRVVGQSGGENLLNQTPTVDQARAKAAKDTTDPFFFSPLFDRVRGLSNFEDGQPGRDQALSMDVFTDDFYRSPEQVSSVFGETFMSDPALTKATDMFKDDFRRRYSDPKYDQQDVERILQSLPAQLTASPRLPEPKKAVREKPTLADYLAQGKTLAQWYAEVAGQGALDAMGGPDSDRARAMVNEAQSSSSVDRARARLQSGNTGAQAISSVPGGVRLPQQTTTRRDSSGSVQRIDDRSFTVPGTNIRSDLNTPVKSQSAQVNRPPARPSGPNVFDRAKSFASGIFNRFFN